MNVLAPLVSRDSNSPLAASTILVLFSVCARRAQVERKRHIGNDIVNIVFVEGCDLGKMPSWRPAIMKTHFTRALSFSPSLRLSVFARALSFTRPPSLTCLELVHLCRPAPGERAHLPGERAHVTWTLLVFWILDPPLPPSTLPSLLLFILFFSLFCGTAYTHRLSLAFPFFSQQYEYEYMLMLPLRLSIYLCRRSQVSI